MEDRVTYGEIRAWFLGSYYNYCRVKLSHQSPWGEGEIEAGYAYSELENSFDMPIEKLMLEVIALVLSAGRSSKEVEKYHLDIISGLLREVDIYSVLEGLPSDEAAELRGDLKVLGLH
ncbi:Immunity protein Imm2 [compost metagenome]